MRWLSIACVLAGCGRIAFDPHGDAQGDVAAPRRPRVLAAGGTPFQSTATFEAWLVTQSASFDIVGPTIELTRPLLAGVDVLILRVPERVYTVDESRVLAEFVVAGGGLFAISGYDGASYEVTNFNSLLIDLQFGVAQTPNSMGPVTAFTPHPITANLTSLPFIGGFELTRVPAGAPTLAMINNSIVAAVDTVGQGRVVTWADDWIMFDQVWSVETEAFWTQALAWIWPTS